MEKVKRINPIYVLVYILVPALLIAAACYIAANDISETAFLVFVIATFLWFVAAPTFLSKRSWKKMDQVLADQGFHANYTFFGSTQKLAIDMNQAKIAITFDWNPFKYYVVPADRIEKAWTEDGKAATNLLKATNYVRFRFLLDGKKYTIYTFRSNRSYSYMSAEVMEGISKADMYAKALEEARDRAKAGQVG